MASGQIVGIDAFVQIEYGGSSFTISGDGNRSTLNTPVEAPEKTAYGPPGRTRQRSACGLKDWTFSMDGFFNDNTGRITAVAASTKGEQVVLNFGPAGSTTGYYKYSGSGVVTTFNVESPVDGMITVTFEAQASSGSLTETTF